MLGSPCVWSSSREKPQIQPSKSINKLISKYCCLLNRTGTPGRTDFKSTTDGHKACREPGHPFLVEFSKPPMAPRTRSKVGRQGLAGSNRLLSTKTPFHPQRHLSSSLAPARSFLPRAGLGAQLARALIWVPGMMMWVTKEARITQGTK